jgi:membrane-bound ClpP family serine protease
MDPVAWIFILFAAGLVLLTAEVFLPTHGLLGVAGAVCVVGGVASSFAINQYVGLTVLAVTALATPFAAALAMKIYPKTPIGRRMVLGKVESRLQPPTVGLGETGVALSELRPMGMCEFGDQRVEVRSDLGMIPAGTKVRVVNVDAGRLVVRRVDA